MSKVWKRGAVWSRNRDGSISLVLEHIVASKQDLLQVLNDFLYSRWFSLTKDKK